MGCTRLRGVRVVERHSDRENVVALYLKEHLGAAEVKILVDHPSREIVYYVDANALSSNLVCFEPWLNRIVLGSLTLPPG